MTGALIRRLSLFAGHVPRHVPVGYGQPQQQIRVVLNGLDSPVDVTHNHVVAALRPLTIALALAPATRAEMLARLDLRLTFSPWSHPGTTLGDVGLRHAGTITVDGTALQLFHRSYHRDACMPWGAAGVFRLYHAWFEWKRRHRQNFRMEPADLRAHQVLYICPRPVVLVTVQHGAASNLFPMDLIGPTDSPYFLMALRNTSPAVALMAASRRMALADVPLEYAASVYRLGEHHREERIDWSTLPFETGPSSGHGLPVLRDALRVRDVDVRETHVVGSHTLFVTRVVHEERRRDGLQLCHQSGPYYRYLALRGTAPPHAP